MLHHTQYFPMLETNTSLFNYIICCPPPSPDCGVNCHKQCKDQVSMECQKMFQRSSGGSCPSTPGPNLRTKGNSWSESTASSNPFGFG